VAIHLHQGDDLVAEHSLTASEFKEMLAAERAGEPFLALRAGDGGLRLFVLGREPKRSTLGRRVEMDLSIPWDGEVSGLHAELECRGGEWTILDDGLSTNGTFVNGQRISGHHRLRDGDRIRIGRTVLTYNAAQPEGGGKTVIAVEPMSSIETVTILITDLVGSTALESRIGPGAADQLRDKHFALLRDAIDKSGGREVKTTGDGMIAAFDSAAQAVSCAVSVQQRFDRRNRSAEERLLIKVGLSLGDATTAGGDYFGMPVIEAARLCDRAQGGQILAKEIVEHLAGGRHDGSFKPIGALKLKGLPDPLSTVEVAWQPLSEEARGVEAQAPGEP
jgi:class 3 adenylate cyclase